MKRIDLVDKPARHVAHQLSRFDLGFAITGGNEGDCDPARVLGADILESRPGDIKVDRNSG
jgi:hypothetical protein